MESKMTAEEIVLGGYKNFAEGDMESLSKLYHPECKITINGSHSLSGTYFGFQSFLENVLAKLDNVWPGFNLDIDFGHYPYVTSTHCVSGFVNSSGIPVSTIKNVYGICKIYETYVGKMKFEDLTEDSFQKLRNIGDEKGSTTGRDRQINWLDLYRLNQAIIINSVNKLIVNKCDIMEQLGDFTLKENKKIMSFGDFEKMKRHIILNLRNVLDENDIIFSGHKDRI